MTARVQKILPVTLPLTIFVVHASVFGWWIIDDAGIVFAVARNVAHGFGLVCQPGGERVEAYSSLPWVMVMVPAFSLGIFDVVWVPKVVSVVMIAATFGVIYSVLEKAVPWGKPVALAALSWTSMQPGFVIWNVSGLENPLYVLLLSILVACVLRDLRTRQEGGSSGRIGLVTGLLSAVRPEGIVFFFAYPLWRVLCVRSFVQIRGTEVLREAIRYTASAGGVVFAFLAFRRLYFGELLPNVFFAKGGPTRQMLLDLLTLQEPMVTKLLDVMKAVGGEWAGGWILVFVLGASVWLWSVRLAQPIHRLFGVLLACCGVTYLLLPGDWMREYRYATPFFLFVYLYGSALLWAAVEYSVKRQTMRARTFALLSTVVLLGCVWLASPRSAAFAQRPTLPIQEVIDSGKHFERLALIFGVTSPSILTPSVGGALLESNLRIYDLGMLCDRVIAHALGEGAVTPDRRRFYDYVFDEVRPALISTSAYHTWLAKFDEDPRFRRNYVPIKEYIDQWVYQRYGVTIYSGEFIRRDISSEKPEIRSQINEEVRKARYFGCADCQ